MCCCGCCAGFLGRKRFPSRPWGKVGERVSAMGWRVSRSPQDWERDNKDPESNFDAGDASIALQAQYVQMTAVPGKVTPL